MLVCVYDSKMTHEHGGNPDCPANRFVLAGSVLTCVDCGMPLIETMLEADLRPEGPPQFAPCPRHCEGGRIYGARGESMECLACEGTGTVVV